MATYRWYEDVFTTRVMHISDCNSLFWNEKFINGLPRLFGEKVKETLSTPLGIMDYDNLTYGDISNTIHNEGMKMCRDLKIQSQASKSKSKYEIGNFCTQYGLPPIALSKRKSKYREKGVVKAQKFSKFHETLVRGTSKPEPRIKEPKLDLEKIYNRFTKSKNEVLVNDLQHEIKETKSEVRTLKQELTIRRVDHNFLDQRLKQLENTSHQGNEESPSFQNPSDDKDESVNPIADMEIGHVTPQTRYPNL